MTGISPPLQWEIQRLPMKDLFAVAWHPTLPRLASVRESKATPKLFMTVRKRDLLLEEEVDIPSPGFTVTIFDPQGSTLHRTVEIECPPIPNFGEHVATAFHPTKPWLLIVQTFGARIVDYARNAEVAQTPAPVTLFGGGWYPDEDAVWLLPAGEEDWVIWRYTREEYLALSFDRDGVSGGAATLHPGGVLIGATWGEYSCGYHLYRPQDDNEAMGRYNEPTASRWERLAYLPTFSPDGTQIAFVVNPYLMAHANIGTVCIYDLATGELATEFSTECGEEKEIGLGFVNGGREIAFAHDSWICLYDTKTGNERHLEDVKKPVISISAHALLPLLACATSDGVTVRRYQEVHRPALRASGAAYDIPPPRPATSQYDILPPSDSVPLPPTVPPLLTAPPPATLPFPTPITAEEFQATARRFSARFMEDNAAHFVPTDWYEEDDEAEDTESDVST